MGRRWYDVEIDAPDDVSAAIGRGPADRNFPRAQRVGFWLLVAAVTLSPFVLTVHSGEVSWFAWRMFSEINAPVEYEIRVDDGWEPTTLDDLGRWHRGSHVGTANLEALCAARPHAASARRLIDGGVDAVVECP